MSSRWKSILAPLGALPTQFAWRFFGFVVIELIIMIFAGENHGPSGMPPISVFAVGVSGALLLFGGPRVVSLIALSISGSVLLVQIASGRPAYQLAEEYLPIAVLPGIAAVLAGWALGRPGARDEKRPGDSRARGIDAAQIALFRVTAVWMMLFAALHKVNVDFFDPSVSCATVHAQRFLSLAGGAGPDIARIVPAMGILAELSVPLLLIFVPRLGLPIVVFIMFYIGHRGATPFTQLVMMLAATFLDEEDMRTLLDSLRRRWPILVALLAVVTAGGALVLRGDDWARYYLWALATTTLGFGAACLVLTRLAAWRKDARQGGFVRGLRGEFARRRLLPRESGARAILVLLAFAIVINAMTPYLGSKFRLSFAMFSNLRVDDASWNSLIFPRAIQLTEHDRYLHVERAGRSEGPTDGRSTGVSRGRSKGPSKEKEIDGLYSRGRLVQTLATRRRAGERFDLQVRYGSESRRFSNATSSSELLSWLETIPDDRLIHEYLPAVGPQKCIH